MSRKNKLSYVQDFFKGKDPEIDPMSLPNKTIRWFAATPGLYFDDDEKDKTYSAQEVNEMGKKYFLIILSFVTTPEEVAMAEEADKIRESFKNRNKV